MLQRLRNLNSRWAAAGVQAAPLLGIPAWLLELQRPSNSWNFPLLFALGLFMLAAGLLLPFSVLLISKRGFVREQAVNTLRFHGVIVLIGIGLGIAFAVATQFDPPNPTMSNPPVHTEAVLMAGAIAFGLVLPVLEFVRAIFRGRRAWREFC